MNPGDITNSIANAAHNKTLKGFLWIVGGAITIFYGVSLYNQSKMHKLMYLKTQLDIEKLKRDGITLPPDAK